MIMLAVAMSADLDTRFQNSIASGLPAFLVNPTGGLESSEAIRNELASVRGQGNGPGVSASQDGTLKVWDLASGVELHTLKGHANGVMAVAVTPDGQQAVSASYDRTLKIWDLASGIELRTLEGHADWVHAVAVTPDGRQAVSASLDRTLKVWDLASGVELRTLKGHAASVTAVAGLCPSAWCRSASPQLGSELAPAATSGSCAR